MKHIDINLKHILQVSVLLLTLLFIVACGQTASTKTPTPPEQPTAPVAPVSPPTQNLSANAGADQEVVVGQSAVLDGSQSSGDAIYSWKLLQKPQDSKVNLDKKFGPNISFRPDIVGSYLAELTLTAGTTTKSDQVSIEVKEFVRTGVIAANAPLTTSNGVVLSSPDDVPTTDVFITSIDKLKLPLPNIYTAVGNSYTVSSKSPIRSPSGKAFRLSLPVPEGSPKDKLALAVLIPKEYQYGLLKKGEVFEDSWLVVEAQLDSTDSTDSTKTQAVAALHMLVPTELQLSLVTHPSFSSDVQSLTTLAATSEHFEVRCSGEFDDVSTNCTNTDERTAVNAIEDIFAEYVQKGFTDEPALRRAFFIGNYVIDLVPNNKPWLGLYTPVLNSIQVTLSSDGVFDDSSSFSEVAISRHEYFHAVQFSYLNPIQVVEVAFNIWSLEGQATSIMNSQNDMNRFLGGFPIRNIETSLLENSFDDTSAPPYEAQDFWVFVGKSINNNMSSLLRFVANGQSADSVNEVFRSRGPFPTLGDAYWAWVKNQAFEATVDIGQNVSQNNALATSQTSITCAVNENAVSAETLSFRPGITANGGSGNNLNSVVRLEPLSSKFFTLQLGHDASPNYLSYLALIQLQDRGNNIKVKVFDDPSGAIQPCEDIPDGLRNIQVPRINSSDGSLNDNQQVHILISNTSHTDSVETILIIDSLPEALSTDAPELTLIRPTRTQIREGTRVGYEVEAISPNMDSNLRWFINGEVVKEEVVPQGRDNYSLSFVPCPQRTVMGAELIEPLSRNILVTHTMEVVPFGEAIVETDQDGRYIGIHTDAKIFRARIRAASCNDPNSSGTLDQPVQWTINGQDTLIADVLKFTKEENITNIGFQYPPKDPNPVRSQMTVYPCEVQTDLSNPSKALPCLDYQYQSGTQKMFEELERSNSQKEVIEFLNNGLNSALSTAKLDASNLKLSRKESIETIASKFGKETAVVLDSLFNSLDNKDIASFDKDFIDLHKAIQEGGFKPTQSALILEAMGLVMTQVDEYTSRAAGGNNRWSQFMFSKDPDGLIQKANVLQPAKVALEAFVSIAATSGKVQDLGGITSHIAVLDAVQSIK